MKIKSFILGLSLFLTPLIGTEVNYIPHQNIHPGQVRFSSKNVEQKMKAALEKGDAIWNEKLLRYEGKYEEKKSIFPKKEALPVVKSPFGPLLIDGHHHVLTALAFNVDWVPVKIVADCSELSIDEFWKEAEKNHWVFLKNLNGEKIPLPSSFSDLQDDPNRYFAAISARKCDESGDLATSIGAEYPLWIKVGKDIPFIEFYISDALREAGLCYTYEMGDEPSVEFVEACRNALIKAQIPGLRVVTERKHFFEIGI